MSTHHALGFSGAHRWMECAGSVALSAGYPDKAGAEAAEGSQAHGVAEPILKFGRVPEGTAAEMLEFVRVYTDGVRDPDWFRFMLGMGNDVRVELAEEWVEERVSLPLLEGEEPVFSTLDHAGVWAIWGDPQAEFPSRFVLVVSDLKYGMGQPVTAEGNPQTRLYLAGMDEVASLYYPISLYAGVIYQPRLDSRTFEVLTPSELDDFVDLAKVRAEATKAPDAPLVPGEKQCRWCRARADCPALAAYARAAVLADFAALDSLEAGEAGQTLARVPDFDPADLGRALRAVPLVKQWLAAVEDEGKARLGRGEPVPGFKLVEGRSNRRWSSVDLAEARMLQAGLEVDAVWKSELISPAAAEKALGRKAFGAADLGELVEKPRGAPTLAPEDDPRPPFVAEVTAADFDA